MDRVTAPGVATRGGAPDGDMADTRGEPPVPTGTQILVAIGVSSSAVQAKIDTISLEGGPPQGSREIADNRTASQRMYGTGRKYMNLIGYQHRLCGVPETALLAIIDQLAGQAGVEEQPPDPSTG
ncbi:hypothetical protein NDU88_004154 [Pleurodeles waltl]|uniref:Uncharacterized protein n=1 Tax=Pleurodeles waltl TaxID=8319 RepID=A0AAV7VFG0_PLEWA|nr:hypothetical protein NDU88_004154 [Pleurodeles waltl]